MEDFSLLKAKALDFLTQAPFVVQILDESEHERSMRLMDELVEDYETYRPLIELLSASIEKWENEANSFSEFNRRIQNQDDAGAVLTTLALVIVSANDRLGNNPPGLKIRNKFN